MGYEQCPDPQPDCKFEVPYADRHHYYWPRKDYKTKLEKQFRSVMCEVLCRCIHDELHQQEPPVKPSPDKMREILGEVDGDI